MKSQDCNYSYVYYWNLLLCGFVINQYYKWRMRVRSNTQARLKTNDMPPVQMALCHFFSLVPRGPHCTQLSIDIPLRWCFRTAAYFGMVNNKKVRGVQLQREPISALSVWSKRYDLLTPILNSAMICSLQQITDSKWSHFERIQPRWCCRGSVCILEWFSLPFSVRPHRPVVGDGHTGVSDNLPSTEGVCLMTKILGGTSRTAFYSWPRGHNMTKSLSAWPSSCWTLWLEATN